MSTSVGPSIHPSRARQFYGGLTFRTDAAQVKSGTGFLIAHQYAKDSTKKRSVGKERDQSKFSRERRRKSKPCFESVVDSLEPLKSEWYCVYCSLTVEIDNKINQVKCPQCHSNHLEAPRRPTRGLLTAR